MNNSIISIAKSAVDQAQLDNLLDNAIGIITMDPVSAKNAIIQLLHLPTTLRDAIYWENFLQYLLNVYEYDAEKDQFRNTCKKQLSEMLAEVVPNEESDYDGDDKRLHENAKRIIKLIDDAVTKQKAIYYANLTRAALNNLISRGDFFKLCKCVNLLTDEDLHFFIKDIKQIGSTTITEDRDNIDDFRSAGLLMEVENGFSYTRRAFELLKYGLVYEQDIEIPNNLQKRMTVGSVSDEAIQSLVSTL